MAKNNLTRRSSDALDLVRMLEHLVGSIIRGSADREEVPWAGIALTLRNCRELLEESEGLAPMRERVVISKPQPVSGYDSASHGSDSASESEPVPFEERGRVREVQTSSFIGGSFGRGQSTNPPAANS